MIQVLKIALDWTPNINHIGIFTALEKEIYLKYNIEPIIISPLADGYELTPGKKLELGLADVAVAPFETVISLNNKAHTVDAIAIFALLQEDLSCIVTLQGSGITRPALLDGKLYASYKARYEDRIVQELVKNDGGTGNLQFCYPEKLGIWNTLLEGKADATWVFDNWEGVEAAGKHVALHKFYLRDYGIPYGYSPILLTRKSNMEKQADAYRRFAAATREGYLYAVAHPAEAVTLLRRHLTEADRRNIDLEQAMAATAPYFGTETTCGRLQTSRVRAFLEWLTAHGLEHAGILQQQLFTNELLA